MEQPTEGDSCSSASNGAPLCGVCDDCCVDGSLMSTDDDASTTRTLETDGTCTDSDCIAREVEDVKCDDVCGNFVEHDTPLRISGVNNVMDSDDDLARVRVRSSDISEKVAVDDDDEKCDKVGGDDAVVDEPTISALDIYGGLHEGDRWNPVSVVRQRELGGRWATPARFTCGAGASLVLVRRLQLYSKLDGHTGCVNALHFNDSGN